jgi:hypothetical protein
MGYVLYAAVVVGIFACWYVVHQYQARVFGLLTLLSVPDIVSKIADPELPTMLREISAIEHIKMRFMVVPFIAVCVTAAICVPFYFQTEIPTWVAVGMSAAIGWLFTYVIQKDFTPTWYVLTYDLITSIIVEKVAGDMILMEQMIAEHAQSTPEE